MEKYLCETKCIDYGNPLVKKKVNELRAESLNSMDYVKRAYLLAALLRANGIPSGISYQRLTRADEDDREGYIIHALNTV